MLMCSLCCLAPHKPAAHNINNDNDKTDLQSSTYNDNNNNCNVIVMHDNKHLQEQSQSHQCAK